MSWLTRCGPMIATGAVAVVLATACTSSGHVAASGSDPVSVPAASSASLSASSPASASAALSAAATSALVSASVDATALTAVPKAAAKTTAKAPARTTAKASSTASIAGCPLFPADNAWRRNVAKDPLDPHSKAWVANIGATTRLHPDFGSDPSYGIPYTVVPASQAKVPITFTAYGSESDRGPYPIPPTAKVEAGGDRHVLVASADCHLYELYNARKSGAGWKADAGAVFNLRSNRLRPDGWTSTDAAGLPILPGLVRRDEIKAGHIDHALRFTVARTQRGYIHPATHQAGSTSDPNVVPMGARLRLKASFDLSHFHGASRIILQALKTYGMIVADNGSNWYISGSTDTGWNDDDLNQLKTVPGSAFEAVRSGTVQH